MSEERAARQVKPLNPRIAFSHDHEWSVYPDTIRIPMADGHVETYIHLTEQPHPAFTAAIGNIRTGYKYGYVGKHAKK